MAENAMTPHTVIEVTPAQVLEAFARSTPKTRAEVEHYKTLPVGVFEDWGMVLLVQYDIVRGHFVVRAHTITE